MTADDNDSNLPPTEAYAADMPPSKGRRRPGPRKQNQRTRRRVRRPANGLPSGVPDLAGQRDLPEPTGDVVELAELRSKSTDQLLAQAQELGVENAGQMHKIEMLFQVAKKLMENGTAVRGRGCLEIVNNHGFLRYPENSYAAGSGDIYLGSQRMRQDSLRSGDEVSGLLAPPRDQD
ncbi:MAG: Rho termination factor N-terminal domain-containing protein, partial [Betaproteobacteria bacterium]|nr:Rho termination factor N-terminal domain-containing protein [Betaproteobacteria bacterium]